MLPQNAPFKTRFGNPVSSQDLRKAREERSSEIGGERGAKRLKIQGDDDKKEWDAEEGFVSLT